MSILGPSIGILNEDSPAFQAWKAETVNSESRLTSAVQHRRIFLFDLQIEIRFRRRLMVSDSCFGSELKWERGAPDLLANPRLPPQL